MRRLRRFVVLVAAAMTATVVPPPAATPAAAAPGDEPAIAIFDGRGWGHGRGLGQYGALGYAQNRGWDAARILDHFYGGTTAGPAPVPGVVDPRRMRVELVFMTGRPTTVALRQGTIRLVDGNGADLGSTAEGAIRLTAAGGGFDVEVGPGCDGPWRPALRSGASTLRLIASSSVDDYTGLLEACGPSYRTWYEGELEATVGSGRQRTVNVVTVEQYLRGVVPNEVPALWPDAVLQAQAVAARSYALTADPRSGSYSDTCDTSWCQVYDGRFTTRSGGLRRSTHPRTDAAVVATAGLVRLNGSGRVARTEFSSSTGGYTAGGDFPAVVDEGDSIAANANATWSTTVDLSGIERKYGRGPLIAIEVTGRNGLGADGGRVTGLRYRFRDGDVNVSGAVARSELGLRSDWFTVRRLTRGDLVLSDPAAIDGFVDTAFRRLGGRAPTDAERAAWRDRVALEGRLELTAGLVRSQHFAGELIDELYLAALGRPSDGDGRAYWVGQVGTGLRFEHLGTLFLGSPEYVSRAGGDAGGFVDALYRDVLGRGADPDGRRYWTNRLETGVAAPADVAAAFYRGRESRRDRAADLHRRIVGTNPAPAELDAMAERLLSIDDFDLAADLATSPTFAPTTS